MSFRDTIPRAWMAMGTVLLCLTIVPVGAQERATDAPRFSREAGWMLHAELGANTRTTWSAASNAPTVSAAPGPMVALGIRRWLGVANAGVAARLAESALELDELGTRWSGGTVRSLQLIGSIGVPVARGRILRADLEAGGGLTLTSAPDNVEPFASSSSALATSDLAVLLRLPDRTALRNNTLAFIQGSMALSLRYQLIRVSPASSTQSTIGLSDPESGDGWVGRFEIGVRITR